jgi:predicted transcriptional regulator
VVEMDSKRKIIEDCIKNHPDGIWMSEIARETRATLATIIKWVKILELEDKVKVKNFAGMRIVKWNWSNV